MVRICWIREAWATSSHTRGLWTLTSKRQRLYQHNYSRDGCVAGKRKLGRDTECEQGVVHGSGDERDHVYRRGQRSYLIL